MLKIRRATIDDCKLIKELADNVFPATYKDILTQQQMDYMMDWMYNPANIKNQMLQDEHVYFIGYEMEIPIGYFSVGKEEENIFHLHKIYVLPKMQGKKFGEMLFNKAVEYIRSLVESKAIMELNVNRYNKAIKFYQKMGMKIDREGDFPIGNGFYMNDFIMKLDIVKQ